MGRQIEGSAAVITKDQIDLCNAPIPRSAVSQREKANITLDYVDGAYVVGRMIEIFGPSGYLDTYKDRQGLYAGPRADGKPGFEAWYSVECTIAAGGGMHTDVGYGSGIGRHLGEAHESGLKEAYTDAFKRAARKFGNSLGLALYDKSGKGISDDPPAATDGAPPAPAKRPSARRKPKEVHPLFDALALCHTPEDMERAKAEIKAIPSHPDYDDLVKAWFARNRELAAGGALAAAPA